MKALAGWVRPSSGSILLGGIDISTATPDSRAQLGLAFVPDDRRIFAALTVEENLQLGLHQTPRAKRDTRVIEQMYSWFPNLLERRRQLGRVLSGGEQQMLSIARALVGNPRVLLIDEPSEGLAPTVIALIFDAIKQMKASGRGVLLIEQNIRRATAVADRCYVMEKGRIVVECEPSRVMTDPALRQRLAV